MDPEFLSLDRLPLPSLKVYTFISVLAASFSVYHIGTESGPALRKLSEQRNNCQLNILLDRTAVEKLNVNNDKLSDFVNLEKSDNHANSIFSSDSNNKFSESVSPSISASLGMFARQFAIDYLWSDANEREVDITSEKNVTESNCLNDEGDYQQLTWQLLDWASQQPHCVWPLVNLLYCILMVGSYAVQQHVFGQLRASENESVKDQFLNFLFYKVVFVFGVVNVQELEEAAAWCVFVTFLGILHLARQLCQERHNYLIMVNDMTKVSEARRNRILRLLIFVFATSVCLFVTVAVWFMRSSPKDFGDDFLDFKYIMIPLSKHFDTAATPVTSEGGYDFNLGLHSAIFILSEILILISQTLHALSICVFDHMYFRLKTCKWNPFSIFGDKAYAENDDEDLYLCASQSINYKFEIVSLMFDLIHHVHMFVCCNLFLSMTSLIVSLQMRLRVKQLHAVLKRRHSFTSLNEHIDRYPDVRHDDVDQNVENCAICWETLASQKSKILPCNHSFHKTCLRKWLLVSMHCPTCRLSLLTEQEIKLRREREPPRRVYGPRPSMGIMGLLQTGQTLLDLFGGWDPLPEEYPEEETETDSSSTDVSESDDQQAVTPSTDANNAQPTSTEQKEQTKLKTTHNQTE